MLLNPSPNAEHFYNVPYLADPFSHLSLSLARTHTLPDFLTSVHFPNIDLNIQARSRTPLCRTLARSPQVMGSFWGSFLASQDWSALTPLYLSALWCAANAVIIYVLCCTETVGRQYVPSTSMAKKDR